VGLGEFVNRTPGAQVEIGAGLNQLVVAGLRPPPPVRFPLSDGRAALEALAAGEVRGKLVLEP
jgi:NADPH2:quinone reductase